MKLLVIGTQLSGKTTLVKYLREHTDLRVSEVDEEILAANNYVWPANNKYKDEILIPSIYDRVAGLKSIIFFANYFAPLSQVKMFRDKGFRVVQLKLSRHEMLRRNKYHMEHERYDDAVQWLDGQIENHASIKRAELIDEEIDATLPTTEIVRKLLSLVIEWF